MTNSRKTQRYDSKKTSMNIVSKVYNQVEFEKGSTVLDYGGGKYETNTNLLASKEVNCKVYDPYNRTENHNKQVMDYFKENPAKYIVCANVLNVIKEDFIIIEILEEIKELLAEGGSCYIQVYEGNRTNEGKETIKGYQRNQKIKLYEDKINLVFKGNYNISRKSNIFSIDNNFENNKQNDEMQGVI